MLWFCILFCQVASKPLPDKCWSSLVQGITVHAHVKTRICVFWITSSSSGSWLQLLWQLWGKVLLATCAVMGSKAMSMSLAVLETLVPTSMLSLVAAIVSREMPANSTAALPFGALSELCCLSLALTGCVIRLVGGSYSWQVLPWLTQEDSPCLKGLVSQNSY